MTTIQAISLFSLATLVVLSSAALLAGWFITASDTAKPSKGGADIAFVDAIKNEWANMHTLERLVVIDLALLLTLGLHSLCVAVRYLVS